VHFSRRWYSIILLTEVRDMLIHHAIWHLPLQVCGFPIWVSARPSTMSMLESVQVNISL